MTDDWHDPRQRAEARAALRTAIAVWNLLGVLTQGGKR